jgi:Photosynthetic reaction centre cytochrome C subunit
MSQHLRRSLLASFAVLFALAITPATQAQTSATPPTDASAPQQPRPHRPRPQPTNLQVLPKDFTGDQVVEIMHKFEDQLGVECDYCHAKNPTPSPTTGHLDFASDANPMKDRARVMMRMSGEINQRFLTQLKTPPADQQVSCGTCHRGNAKPKAFVPTPDEAHPQAAPPAGTRPTTASPQ